MSKSGDVLNYVPILVWKRMKIFIKTACGVLLCALLLASMCSCVSTEHRMYSFDVFDTVSTIIGYESSKEQFDTIAQGIIDELLEYHKLFDIYKHYDGYTNLYDVNRAAGSGVALTVDSRIIELLTFAKEMYYTTDGRVNVAMGAVLSIWHDYRAAGEDDPVNAELPPQNKLVEAGAHIDIESIIIDKENSTVYISDPKTRLDVGAVAKGYAVERVASRLSAEGVSGYLLNIGGNVRIVGEKPGRDTWLLGVQSPENDGSYLSTLSVDKSSSLVTSGTYQRYYIVDGKPYHHIIDGDTFYPGDKYLSVSVLCADSGVADALSTALFLLDETQGRELVEKLGGIEVMWVYADGFISSTDGFSDLEQ